MAYNETPPPEMKDAPIPGDEEILNSNREYSGFRGRDGSTNILQSDGDSPEVVLQSSGNIYLNATSTFQSACSDCIQSVSGAITQYLNDVTRNIGGTEHTLIGGNQDIFVNSDRTVEVVGEQSLNIAQSLNTTIGDRQETEVESNQITTVHGDRHVIVDKDIFETTDGSKSLTTKAHYIRTIMKDSSEYVKCNKTTTVEGDTYKINLKDNVIRITSDGQIFISGKSKTSIVVEDGDVVVNGNKVAVSGKVVDVSSDKGTVNINGQGGNVNIGSDTAVNLSGTIV